MSGLSGVGGGGFSPAVIKQFQQNLFSQIDTNGDGLVSKTELEQAVTNAGGGTQAADALYSVLDPNNSGGFSEQQLAQVLPGSGFSDQMQAQMIGYQAQGWPGASSAQPGGQLAQNLFSQIDSNGDGSISQSELEQAVTKAGGTKAAADALYAKLDPNGTGSVSEQQFAQGLASLSQPGPTQGAPHAHHHHHGGGGGGAGAASATDDGGADDALTSLFNADSGGASNSPTQIAQNIFSQIDSSGTGAITQGELEQAVTAAGGSTTGADALYAKLDPNGTGSVTQQQFIDALQPPSASGNTAQDALLTLIDPVTPTGATAPVGGVGTATGTTPIGTGTTAQDALSALVQSFDPAAGAASDSGNSAQDALAALVNGNGGSSNGSNGTAATGAINSADFTHALSLYQNQLEQQLLAGISATQNAGIAA